MPAAFESIDSRQNPRFKVWLNYAGHPEAWDCPWIPVEGARQVRELRREAEIRLLLFSDPDDKLVKSLLGEVEKAVQLAPKLLASISNVESPQGVIAFVDKPRWGWDRIGGWVVYLDRIQDPGNLGTLLRTAAATGMFSIITSPGTVSCFNAKVVRASASALFVTPFLEAVPITHVKQRGFRITAAGTEAGKELYRTAFQPPNAIVIGNEGAGVAREIQALADDRIVIPMRKGAESLNASVAGAVIMYEIYRQKMFP